MTEDDEHDDKQKSAATTTGRKDVGTALNVQADKTGSSTSGSTSPVGTDRIMRNI